MHKNCPLITGISGFATLAFGIMGSWYIFPYFVNREIHKNIDLVPGTQAYGFWEKQPFPLKFKVTFFNVTNPLEVQNGGHPKVKEIGPYVYDEFRIRQDISVDEDRDVLKYMLKKTFFFNKNDSGCRDEDDVVTIINAALVGTALQVNIMLPSALATISEAIPYLYPGAKDIFLTAKVRDILFEGIRLYCQAPEVQYVCSAMKGMLPKTIHQDENGDFLFSMFGHLNGTDDGPWAMGRGLKNSIKGQVYSYEEEDQMDIWGDEYCNMINGSDSTVFEPITTQKRPPRIYSFAQDFCRSLYATYEKESTEFGLAAVRYTSTPDSLGNTKENECFCPIRTTEEGDDYLDCPPSGLADITPCFKAPVLISYPHFYLGDPKLHDYVSGLKPVKELHENYANLEPLTGTPLSGRKRVQVNIQLRKLETFELLANVSEGIFPVLWIEEGVTLPDDVANILVSNLSKLVLLDVFKWLLITTGMILMAVSLGMVMKREGLLCFANNATADITTIKTSTVQDEPNRGHEMNPALYPQIGNKNTSDNYTQRNRTVNQQWDSNVWQN